MFYLGTCPNQPPVADLLNRHRIGLMCQPGSNRPKSGWWWAADNGCFADQWNEARWLAWLAKDHPRSGCLFAVVPDVVGNVEATDERFAYYRPIVAGMGYPIAYVAQDGCVEPPWRNLSTLFIGGTDRFKLSEQAFALAHEARARNKLVHCGRINSWRRFKVWAPYADTCDGTFLAFGPTVNTPKLVRWLDRHDESPQLDFA